MIVVAGSMRTRTLMRGALAVVCLGAPACDFSPSPMEPLPGVYEMIGADGGSLRSEDGVLTVDVPAGALANEMEFRIVVTLDAPPSIGMAYHVEPSMSLSKPVLVTYNYAGVDVSNRDLEALRVGRDIGGQWEMLATDKADVAASWVAAKDDEVSFNYGLVEEQHGVAVGDDEDEGDDAAEGSSGDGKEPSETDGNTDPGESDDGMSTGGEEPAGSSGDDAGTTGGGGEESTGGPGNGNGNGSGNGDNGD